MEALPERVHRVEVVESTTDCWRRGGCLDEMGNVCKDAVRGNALLDGAHDIGHINQRGTVRETVEGGSCCMGERVQTRSRVIPQAPMEMRS